MSLNFWRTVEFQYNTLNQNNPQQESNTETVKMTVIGVNDDPEVTELIQGYTIAKTMECTEVDLMQTIFPHPTLSEMMHESVLDAYDRVLHI